MIPQSNQTASNQTHLKLPDGSLQTVSYFEGAPIRVLFDKSGHVLLVAVDIARALGYSNQRGTIKSHVHPKDKGVRKMYPLKKSAIGGGLQETTVINQSGFNSLMIHSKKPKAKAFTHFVTSEIIPEIMETGKYKERETNDLENLFMDMFQEKPHLQQQTLTLPETEPRSNEMDAVEFLRLAKNAKALGAPGIAEQLVEQAMDLI